MSHGNSHDTRQGLHDEVHQEDSPSRQPVDLDSDEEMQAPERKDTRVPGFGANPIIKTMYEDKLSSGVCQWTDKSQGQISKEVADDQHSAAIKLFRIKDRGKVGFNGDYHWKVCRVDVQNPLLVSTLTPILKKENVHLDPRSVATFKEPFRPLWFQHGEIVDLFCEKHDGPLGPFLKLFVGVLDELFRALSAKTAKLRQIRGSRGNGRLVIICKTISFSGEGFYWSKGNLIIPEFTGNKPIRELGCYPFKFHNDKDSITERLTARGRKVLDLQGVAYRTYNGIAIYEADRGTLRQNVNGRILIDAWGYHKPYCLLSGLPGTGKTLMVEAIADRLRRPLYHLQADDLGTEVASLGVKFQRTSKIASAWNAIILLDEADVFIARREPRDVERNGLFCALLRELEYFSGIIFLTTNLVRIDSAFRSRVIMHLVFPPLAREARKKNLAHVPQPSVAAERTYLGGRGVGRTLRRILHHIAG
ncbi:AAA domain-containing protein [Fusarium sp. Ph1]|nr:AAA domain-containing protein [Fusarium sp. Ph1]